MLAYYTSYIVVQKLHVHASIKEMNRSTESCSLNIHGINSQASKLENWVASCVTCSTIHASVVRHNIGLRGQQKRIECQHVKRV